MDGYFHNLTAGQCHTQKNKHYMDNFRALKRKNNQNQKPNQEQRLPVQREALSTSCLHPINALTAEENRATARPRFSVPEATASFTEVDHLLSAAELPGEIQSVAKQGW